MTFNTQWLNGSIDDVQKQPSILVGQLLPRLPSMPNIKVLREFTINLSFLLRIRIFGQSTCLFAVMSKQYEPSAFMLGAIQGLRNADCVGGSHIFRGKSVTKV